MTRVWHSAAAMPYDPDFTEVILFGGSRDVLLENVVAETSLFKFGKASSCEVCSGNYPSY